MKLLNRRLLRGTAPPDKETQREEMAVINALEPMSDFALRADATASRKEMILPPAAVKSPRVSHALKNRSLFTQDSKDGSASPISAFWSSRRQLNSTRASDKGSPLRPSVPRPPRAQEQDDAMSPSMRRTASQPADLRAHRRSATLPGLAPPIAEEGEEEDHGEKEDNHADQRAATTPTTPDTPGAQTSTHQKEYGDADVPLKLQVRSPRHSLFVLSKLPHVTLTLFFVHQVRVSLSSMTVQVRAGTRPLLAGGFKELNSAFAVVDHSRIPDLDYRRSTLDFGQVAELTMKTATMVLCRPSAEAEGDKVMTAHAASSEEHHHSSLGSSVVGQTMDTFLESVERDAKEVARQVATQNDVLWCAPPRGGSAADHPRHTKHDKRTCRQCRREAPSSTADPRYSHTCGCSWSGVKDGVVKVLGTGISLGYKKCVEEALDRTASLKASGLDVRAFPPCC